MSTMGSSSSRMSRMGSSSSRMSRMGSSSSRMSTMGSSSSGMSTMGSSSSEFLTPNMSELRVVLLGNCWSQKASVGNLLLNKEFYNVDEEPPRVSTIHCELIKNKALTVINTPDGLVDSDLWHPYLCDSYLCDSYLWDSYLWDSYLVDFEDCSFEQWRAKHIQHVKSLSAPGPHVFLLVLQPEDFTEQHKTTLQSVLQSFSEQAFNHSLVLISTARVETPGLMEKHMNDPQIRDMIRKCNYRYLHLKNLEIEELLTRLTHIVKENNGEHVRCLSTLNLVLCGSRGAEKSSVVQSMLGQAAAPSPGQCVQHQGEVCGRWVSLVELPALSGKHYWELRQQYLSCISLCGPEGVHAFILVLPVGPLTDQDKAELNNIRLWFCQLQPEAFTMILFTVDSDPTTAVVESVKGDRDFQELSQSCGGGYLIFNTRGKQQVSEFLDYVETLKMTLKNTPTCLRIALIGKTGTGKSYSGNTILGRKGTFQTKPSQNPVTKVCQKEVCKVDGRAVAVVDTPGLFDTTKSDDEVDVERLKCISLLAPGPHVFLLVLQLGRFTQEERETLELIKKTLGKGVEKFMIILFTHGDELRYQDSEMSIDTFIDKHCDDSFKQLLSECGNKYHVFNNREEEDRTQVTELLEKIIVLVRKNRGGCYTIDMLLEAEAAVKAEMERKYKQEINDLKQVIDKEKEKNAFIVRKLERILERVKMGDEDSASE